MLARRDDHRPPRAAQLVRDLDTGRRGADDEHATAGNLVRSPVAVGGQLVDRRVDPAGGRRHPGPVLGPGHHHHVAREPGSLAGDHAQAAGGRLDKLDRGVLVHRGCERAGVVLQVGNQLRCRHVAVWVGARVGPGGQSVHPVGSDQPQRLPPGAAPPFGDPPSFHHDMIGALPGQAAADRQPGLAGPDDDGLHSAHGRSPPPVPWSAGHDADAVTLGLRYDSTHGYSS